MNLTGECFCGSVSYEIRGKVFDARSCHCSRCRKAFNSQASSYALVDPEEFSWSQGLSYLQPMPVRIVLAFSFAASAVPHSAVFSMVKFTELRLAV
jgi:hypothetical protein